jgi:hypothetical protein
MHNDSHSHQPPHDPVDRRADVPPHAHPADTQRDVHVHNYSQEPRGPAPGPGPGLIVGLVVAVLLVVLVWWMFARGGGEGSVLPDRLDIDVNLPAPTQPQTPQPAPQTPPEPAPPPASPPQGPPAPPPGG